MPLDTNERGILEKVIDNLLESATGLTKTIRGIKGQLAVKDESEYTYGFVQGYILGTFWMTLNLTKGRPPTDDEMAEIFETISRRGNEIKDAIFKAG